MAEREKVTVRKIVNLKGKKPIVMITAYDYPTAKIVDEVGVDIILVGDSLSMTVLGNPSTLQVDMNDMLRHTAAVSRAQPKSLLVADMPFLSYEANVNEAVRNAGEFLRVGADAVKIEGGSEYTDVVKALTRAGIPVMGHVGLTPQKHKLLGGYRLMGKTAEEAKEIIEDAEAIAEAGAFSIVIEYTASEVAAEVTKRVKVPTICIGSGPFCDGQVLVIHDVLGLSDAPPPFAKKYVNLKDIIASAIKSYKDDVENNRFPQEEMYWHMKDGEYERLLNMLRGVTSPEP
ncbi:3-methyl-2-oxobutanoate hydroxymethyltransferase [Acidilobus saccharovorans 345-15]|uniref:3-methyl-2-oxobutanoate hydroxymethyltransferase n=1 Tax=Acidilobus saccharovorans (strain DSM 16705 / JCM 18335 / VKM B-2471 / 345-15) TaxID=666510 RepID=D9Q2W0_ACIS3|nr:3-methyl-2-oxobutanoate hydroxymethyltransferase [Acidilobus saccharovorans]ADL19648.1 3-methyl-2-oxobutanoate hydroxymethyltransferase [Acidilobus saccharovorans 345-15]